MNTEYTYDASGDVDQFIQYMPLRQTQDIAYGELLVDQRSSGHDIRFPIAIGITGKERDEETGLDYFGARYYASDLSVWLSVDPLADIAAGISPFAYVNNNPIMLIDEWGLTPRPIRKFKQWLKRRKRGIKVKKVPHVTREVKFKKVVLADGEIDGSIDSRGIMKDGVFLIKEGHNINKYLNNAESFKISFSGASTDGINVSLKKNNRKGKIVFNGREGENETDWIKLRNIRRRFVSINYEKVIVFDKKIASVFAYYKNYQVSANITASKSYFKHIEKMTAREKKKREYLSGKSKSF